jgi:N-carbamoyl-L-amino-acid hydrolase
LRFLDVTIEGMGNHAGSTPMDQRQDAVLAAAKFTVAVNDAARTMPGRQVATVGRVVPSPNTRNVIAGRVDLTVDFRDLNPATLDTLFATLERHAAEIAAATNTRFTIRTTQRSEPALADARMMDIIASSASALGLSSQRMPSGAGHDAQSMAHIAPMAMIFVPSVGGISHAPQEYTTPEDCANGADMLLNAVVAADAL